MGKNIPPLIIQKLSNEAQEKDDKIKRNLHTTNKNWNYCKFQIHRKILEYVNTRSKIVIKESY